MILSKEAQGALILLAKRRLNKPSYEFWGSTNMDTGDWTCLACGTIIKQEMFVLHSGDPLTHLHGLECLKKHGLLVFI